MRLLWITTSFSSPKPPAAASPLGCPALQKMIQEEKEMEQVQAGWSDILLIQYLGAQNSGVRLQFDFKKIDPLRAS